MSAVTATVPPRKPKVNRIGQPVAEYRGGTTTLCPGCGHNSISERIIECFWELGVDQTQVIKMSGIGCSSKSPAYFLQGAHGFNSVHGRMPSVTTGAVLANRTVRALGVTGDGDTASIGLGQFIHLMRRNLPMIYIIEDNGCYGLTKGQFSATADQGSVLKSGVVNELPPIDTCALAIQLGATYVARSFSGDKKQLQAIIKGAMGHNGTAVIDVISPCVTFNDHSGSTKSYEFVKEHKEELHQIGFVPYYDEIHLDEEVQPGEVRDVPLHDGSHLLLRRVEQDYDPTNKMSALHTVEDSAQEGHLLTGVLYVDNSQPTIIELLQLVDEPLATLPEERVRPSREALAEAMEELT